MKSFRSMFSGTAILLFLLFSVGNAQSANTISLVQGWNLVSLPLQPPSTAITSVLSGIKGAYEVVWAYPSQTWKVYDPNDAAGSTLATMQAGMGYWIKMTSAKTLSVSGTTPSPSSISLSSGWNLVGYNGLSCAAPSTSSTGLSALGTNLQVLWGYPSPSQGWEFYDPANSSSRTLLLLCPGAGYWIDVNQAATWALGSVSGTAAAGAAITGLAYLKDSAGVIKGPITIGSDGSFSFDVTGLKAPFYLRATGSCGGEAFDIYSAATNAGTANINPLTNVAVAAAAGVNDPSSVYSNPAQYPITQVNLAQAVTDIQNMLKPLLDAYSANVNPLTGVYAPNHTGLDAVFDVVSVSLNTSSGTVTVLDKTTNTTIASAPVTSLSTPSQSLASASVPSYQAVTDLQTIAGQLSALATLINSKGTALTPADVDPYFATSYGVDDGLNRTEDIADFAQSFANSPSVVGMTNLSILEKIGSDYRVFFEIHTSDGSIGYAGYYASEGTVFTKEGGQWKIRGNGYYSEIDMEAGSWKIINTDGSISLWSGIAFWPADKGNNGLQSVRITGPGLPSGGITYSKPAGEPVNLFMESAYQTPTLPYDNVGIYVMSDMAIQSIPNNALYTFTFYASDGTTVRETRTAVLPCRPLLASELSDGYFASLGVTSHALSAAKIGGTLTFSYTLPVGGPPANLWASLGYWGSTNHDNYDMQPLMSETSASIVVPAASGYTPTGAALDFEAQDAFWRTQTTVWIYQ